MDFVDKVSVAVMAALTVLLFFVIGIGVGACTAEPPYRQCVKQYERCISVKTNDGDLWVKAP